MGAHIFVLAELAGRFIDLAGVGVMIIGMMIATTSFVTDWILKRNIAEPYTDFRKNLGRVILLGLEFLVAGDIIRSVAGTPSFYSVGVLACIVLIRSFLSVTFEMEINGRWPWQKKSLPK